MIEKASIIIPVHSEANGFRCQTYVKSLWIRFMLSIAKVIFKSIFFNTLYAHACNTEAIPKIIIIPHSGRYARFILIEFFHLSVMTEDGKDILVKFGANLKRIRLAKGLTILDLEVRSNINNGDISKIENGKRNLSLTTMVKLAEGLGVPLKEIVNFDLR